MPSLWQMPKVLSSSEAAMLRQEPYRHVLFRQTPPTSQTGRETFRAFIETNLRYMDDLPAISRDRAEVSHDLWAVYQKCASGLLMTAPASRVSVWRSCMTSTGACTTVLGSFDDRRKVTRNRQKVSSLIRLLVIDRRSITTHTGERSIDARPIGRNTPPHSADPRQVTRDAAAVSRVGPQISRNVLALVSAPARQGSATVSSS